MCTNCAAAAQGFADGSAPRERPLQTSVQQGTSPDWSRWIADGDVIDEARGDYGQNDD